MLTPRMWTNLYPITSRNQRIFFGNEKVPSRQKLGIFSQNIFPINHEIILLNNFIFKDVDPEDVDELVPNNCKFEVTVILSIGPGNHGNVSNVWFNLQREDFEFDTTWFSSHFHDLDQVWSQQQTVLTSALKSVITESFESAIAFNPPEVWLKNKFRQLNQTEENQETVNNQSQIQNDTKIS